MKKLLPLLLACALTAQAAPDLPVRSAGRVMKTINTSGHAATLPHAPMRAPMVKAPENSFEVPFMHTLGKSEESTKLYVAIDANNDGKTWKVGGFSAYSACLGPAEDANDDWMISPAVYLTAGTEYTISFEEGINTPSDAKEGLMSVYMGAAQTAEAMTECIVPEHSLTFKFTPYEKNFTVAADGYYHFGFHSTTTKAKTAITTLKNFSITKASEKIVPAAAGELSYALAPKGELKATVTYTAPTKDIEGGDLESISKVVVKTNWVETHTFTDVTPGQTITFETELYNSAYNRIEATAYVSDTAGEAAIIKDFYAGPDNPKPLTGLRITLSDDYKHVTVSWDAPSETGENGGYVDTDRVTYYIFDAFGSYYDPAIATTTETSYTFDYSDLAGQDFVAYQVTAGIDETYYSLASTSDIVIVGEPDALPFGESFSNATYARMWAIDPATTSSAIMCGTLYDNELQTNADNPDATPEYLNSQDGDNGFFYIMPIEKDAVYGFFSTKIDISKAANPVYEFWYQGKGSLLEAMVAADGGEFKTIRAIDLKEEPTGGWTLCRIDLSEFGSSRYIQIELRLKAIHNDDETTWSVPIDNIRVRDLTASDLRLVTLHAPARIKAGESATLEAYIENLGTEACTGAKAVLFKDGSAVAEAETGDIAPDAFATVKFGISASVLDSESVSYTVEIVSDTDTNPADNIATADVTVDLPVLPTVTALDAAASDNGISLSWNAPEFADLTAPRDVTEDFESDEYTPLTISDFGGWTLVDADKRKTYNILRETANPYQTQPQAFQLFNPVLAGVPDDYLIDITPHSGDQFLVAWSAQGQNDNWLISPELSGRAQTISFFAKSFTIAFPETFEVLYSTTGTDIDSFVKLETVGNYPEDGIVSEDWTEYTAELPEGALHFAIRHTANDTYAFYVDDISYSGASAIPADTELLGYNIYRDGEKINEAPVADTFATDSPEAAATYSYRVSAVYNHGESRACSPVEAVLTSGIGAIDSDNAPVEYYNIQGIRVNRPENGVYIRRQGSTVTKAVVR